MLKGGLFILSGKFGNAIVKLGERVLDMCEREERGFLLRLGESEVR